MSTTDNTECEQCKDDSIYAGTNGCCLYCNYHGKYMLPLDKHYNDITNAICPKCGGTKAVNVQVLIDPLAYMALRKMGKLP